MTPGGGGGNRRTGVLWGEERDSMALSDTSTVVGAGTV